MPQVWNKVMSLYMLMLLRYGGWTKSKGLLDPLSSADILILQLIIHMRAVTQANTHQVQSQRSPPEFPNEDPCFVA